MSEEQSGEHGEFEREPVPELLLRGRTVDLETTFSDFREVGGVVFPHRFRTRAKGDERVLEVIVEGAELNPPIDDARFEMPGG